MSTNTSRLGLVKGDLIRMSYRLHRIVGAGGFGEVWQAEQLQGEAHLRNVAIKLFAAPDRGDGEFGWLHEARTIMEIEPMASVPRTFDVGVDPAHDVAFIAMELLHGHTLESRLARGSVPWRHALRIARAIADALQHCHRHGIVHCDLKPQNIFLTDTGRVVVLDFGIASLRGARFHQKPRPAIDVTNGDAPQTEPVADEEVARLSTSRIETPAGTPGYIAPEQLAGLPPEPSADVYSLGVVFYRMIAGRFPYRLDNTTSQLSMFASPPTKYIHAMNVAAMNGHLVPLSEVSSATPRSILALIGRMLAPRSERITADAIGAALEDAWEHPHGTPRPPYVGLKSFGPALVPLDLHYSKGRVKISVGLAKGKKQFDKLETEKERDWGGETARLIRAKG